MNAVGAMSDLRERQAGQHLVERDGEIVHPHPGDDLWNVGVHRQQEFGEIAVDEGAG
jgi:hypothetical protein